MRERAATAPGAEGRGLLSGARGGGEAGSLFELNGLSQAHRLNPVVSLPPRAFLVATSNREG